MGISRSFDIAPKVIPAGTLGAALKAAIDATGAAADGQELTARVSRRLADGSEETNQDVPIQQLDSIVDLTQAVSIGVSAGEPNTNWHYIGFHGGRPGMARIHVSTPTAGIGQSMIDAFTKAAGVEPYVPPAPDPELEPEQAGSSLAPTPEEGGDPTSREQGEPGPRRLRAFVSYRFGQAENETSATLIQRFLELENVEVLTGRSYEPRPLHEKVSDRLRGVDFLVLLIGTDGESMWTRDEIATARAAGVAVVPIVTDPSTFAPGLFGDQEYITVALGHPADALLPLLEAVTYLRRRST